MVIRVEWVGPGQSEREYTCARVGDEIIERKAEEENFSAFKERLTTVAKQARRPIVVIEPLRGSEAGL